MRRIALISAVLVALAAPAAVLAAHAAAGDGSLVVQNAAAPYGMPVVQLTITGSVIGQIDHGKVVIDPGPNSEMTPQVIGYESRGDSVVSSSAQWWKGFDVKFRAVGCKKCTVLVYGSGVDLVAVGQGTVRLSGIPDTPGPADGRYSLNARE